MLVQLMASQMLRSLKPGSAIRFRAQKRSIFTLFMQLVDVHLKLRVCFESQFAQLADKVAAVSLHMNRIIASCVEH